MNTKYLNAMPQWYKDKEEHSLIMSDDIDSLLTVAILNKVKGWKTAGYYDFENLYKSADDEMHTRVWCDIAFLGNEKAFDNHVSRYNIGDRCNSKCINPNLLNGVTAQNYTEKYCGSTALMVWSIYNLPLPETEEGKMLLLCVDSMFKGFYKGYKRQNRFYLCEMFGYNSLYEVEKRHEIDEFYGLIEKYNLTDKFELDENGILHTEMDLEKIGQLLGLEIELPKSHFILTRKLRTVQSELYAEVSNLTKAITLAFTYRRKVRYSMVA